MFPGRGFSPRTSRIARLASNRGTDRTAGQDPAAEVEAAGPERLQLEGGTPSHLLGVEDGDRPIVLVHVGRPPVANPLQQPRQAGVGGGVRAQPEHHPVPAGLDLRALTGTAFSLSNRPPEPLRPRQAELNCHQALHPDQANQTQHRPDRPPCRDLAERRQGRSRRASSASRCRSSWGRFCGVARAGRA
jgi:hypothetical protein